MAIRLASKNGRSRYTSLTERSTFANEKLESIGTGAARGPWIEQAFLLKLAPQESVGFAQPPGDRHPPKGKTSEEPSRSTLRLRRRAIT